MESAAKKLKNSRGASIILALVFLLVCVMVGSSVLMAAAANAGRSRSNRQEQQLYLVLSSALHLVADDLTGAEYTCQVKYERWIPEYAIGKPLFHEFTPLLGKMAQTEDESKSLFADIFCPALDSISKADIRGILEEQYPEKIFDGPPFAHDYYWHYDYDSAEKTPQSFTLTVKPEETGPLEGYEAQVDVTIDINYRITLTARMTKAPDTKALDLFQNYSLTTTLTRSGMVSLTIPAGENDILSETISAGTITWKAGKVIREYRDAAVPPGVGP